MSAVVLSGNTSGQISVEAPAIAGNHTLTLPAVTGTLATVQTLVTKTANYPITNADGTVICTTNAFTVTLPTAVGIGGQTFTIKNGNTVASTNAITMATTSAQTIDGLAPSTIAPLASLTVVSDNANWWSV